MPTEQPARPSASAQATRFLYISLSRLIGAIITQTGPAQKQPVCARVRRAPPGGSTPRRAYGMIERAAGAMRPYGRAACRGHRRAGTEIHGDPILISFMKHTLFAASILGASLAPAPRSRRAIR